MKLSGSRFLESPKFVASLKLSMTDECLSQSSHLTFSSSSSSLNFFSKHDFTLCMHPSCIWLYALIAMIYILAVSAPPGQTWKKLCIIVSQVYIIQFQSIFFPTVIILRSINSPLKPCEICNVFKKNVNNFKIIQKNMDIYILTIKTTRKT